MATTTHTRRALFGAMAIAPIVIAAPALAQATGPSAFRLAFDANLAAEKRFNSLPSVLSDEQEEDEHNRMMVAWTRFVEAKPTTLAEFVEKYDHYARGGYQLMPSEIAKQMDEARALLA